MEEKSGLADAMDYAINNGDWTTENDIAVALFVSFPIIGIILVVLLGVFIYKMFKRCA